MERSQGLRRRTPIARKRARPRRTLTPRCSRDRCNKRAEALDLCGSHLEQEADRVFSLWVRAREDQRCAFGSMLERECWGRLEAAHLIGRSNHAVRYEPDNVRSACSLHHVHLDTHPDEKTAIAVKLLGYERYAELRRIAATHERPDLPAVIARYSA